MNLPPSPACINLCVGTNRTNSPPSPACTNLYSPTVRNIKQRLRDRKPDWRSNLTIVSGTGLSSVLARLVGWPQFVSLKALFTAVVFSTIAGVFFGYYPAGKAAKLNPIEALRYE